ncbi:MAG: LysE family transporter [Nonlabens sp.]
MMYLAHLLIGLAIGFLGVVPPGLLNLTAAKISIKQGSSAAHFFALGATLIVVGQVYVGVFFSKLLMANPDLVTIMEQAAVVAFVVLSIFFFIKARIDKGQIKIDASTRSTGQLIGQGIILSLLNVFPVPFYLGFSSFLAGRGWFIFEPTYAYLFIVGAVMGTYGMLAIYIKYVRKFSFDSNTFAKKTNYLLSMLTMAIALFTATKLYF